MIIWKMSVSKVDENIKASLAGAWNNKMLWRPKLGVVHLTNPEKHEHGGLVNFESLECSSTSGPSIRMYLPSTHY